MPSRMNDIRSGVKFLSNLNREIGLPLLFTEPTNFQAVIPKKTTSCVMSISVPGEWGSFIPDILNVGILRG